MGQFSGQNTSVSQRSERVVGREQMPAFAVEHRMRHKIQKLRGCVKQEKNAGLSLFLRQQWRLTSDSREDRQVQETASAETVAYWTETVLDYDRGCHRKRHVQVHYTCL